MHILSGTRLLWLQNSGRPAISPPTTTPAGQPLRPTALRRPSAPVSSWGLQILAFIHWCVYCGRRIPLGRMATPPKCHPRPADMDTTKAPAPAKTPAAEPPAPPPPRERSPIMAGPAGWAASDKAVGGEAALLGAGVVVGWVGRENRLRRWRSRLTLAGAHELSVTFGVLIVFGLFAALQEKSLGYIHYNSLYLDNLHLKASGRSKSNHALAVKNALSGPRGLLVPRQAGQPTAPYRQRVPPSSRRQG